MASFRAAPAPERQQASPLIPRPSHPGLTVWFTGLSGAGKSTISKALYERLYARGYRVELLDGDVVRQHLSKGLGFSKEDRDENIRRIGFVAQLLSRHGVITLVAAISPYREARAEVRREIGSFLEVYVNAPLDLCRDRDPKGLYQKSRLGLLSGLTGVDDPYEPPISPEIECRTDEESLTESVDKVWSAIEKSFERMAASRDRLDTSVATPPAAAGWSNSIR